MIAVEEGQRYFGVMPAVTNTAMGLSSYLPMSRCCETILTLTVTMTNVLLGWTIVGWIGVLIWAFTRWGSRRS
jgi:hypothetical protein